MPFGVARSVCGKETLEMGCLWYRAQHYPPPPPTNPTVQEVEKVVHLMWRLKWVFVQDVGGGGAALSFSLPPWQQTSMISEWVQARRGQEQGDQACVCLGSKPLGSAWSCASWQSSVSVHQTETGSPHSRYKESAFGWRIFCLLSPQELLMHQ